MKRNLRYPWRADLSWQWLFATPDEQEWYGSLPAIVPSAGAEMLIDPGLEVWTSATDLTNWSEAIAGTSTVNRESSVVHGGSFAARFNIDGSNSLAQISQTVSLSAGTWYQVLEWIRADAASGFAGQDALNLLPISAEFALTTAYTQQVHTGLATVSGSASVAFKRGNAAQNRLIYFDDLSYKPLTLASLFSTRFMQQVNGIYTNHPSKTLCSQAGIVHLADANNQVVVFLEGTGAAVINIRLVKNVAGTWTTLATVPVTYVAGAELSLKRMGPAGNGLYSVTYNGVVVIPVTSLGDTTFDTLMAAAQQWGNFSTYAGNTFGAQSWGGQHDTNTYQQHLIEIAGPSLINYLLLNDAVAGGTANDPSTDRDWTYGASNVSSAAGIGDGLNAASFGGAAAGQVTPSASTLTALNTAGVFDPLEGTLAIWAWVSAANMGNASIYGLAEIGVDSNNRFTIYKNAANSVNPAEMVGGNSVFQPIAYTGGVWAHFAAVWSQSGNFRRGYKDGAQIGVSSAYAGTWAGSLTAAWSQIASINNSFYGPILAAHKLLTNRAFSAAEIAALARGGY